MSRDDGKGTQGTPTWLSCCQSLQNTGRQDRADIFHKSGCFSYSLGGFMWAQTYTSLCIFVLKWKTLQNSERRFRKRPTLMWSGHDWWIWPLPPHLHVWQPDLYGLPLISTFPHALAAASGASSSLADYLADMGYISWLYRPMPPSPPLLTATKWRRHKYVPGKLYHLKCWDGKK